MIRILTIVACILLACDHDGIDAGGYDILCHNAAVAVDDIVNRRPVICHQNADLSFEVANNRLFARCTCRDADGGSR